MSLPTAATTRWQPMRTGLVDLFYYDDQEFWFRDGRILFRGNNGTGKSKVLALTLPFLLDGELSPSRVEPDGDPGKRMEWNLLLGDRYEERLGYSWLEFGRVTEDGERAYVTVGCGMKAVKGRGIADRWFFLTSQRVGRDLFLIGENGTALTRDRLTEAVGVSGQVTQTAEGYRRLLDEHLFHLGLERYEALVNLLIQLRQPQLSKRPDEKKLSAALSQALAPVDQALISDVAGAFHDLEQQREELSGLRDTHEHVRRFLTRYQRYAAVAARRQSAELRSAHSSYEQVNRDLGAVAEQIEQSTRAEAEAEERTESAQTELAEQQAIREELAGDSRIKDLDTAERYADEADRALSAEEAASGRAQATAAARRARHGEAVAAAAVSHREVAAHQDRAAPLAERTGLAVPHATLLASLGEEPGGDGIRAAVDSRAAAVAHVTRLAREAVARERDLGLARSALAKRESERDRAADRLADVRGELAAAMSDHVTAWRGYALGLRELTLPDPEEYALAAWAETLSGPHPGERALHEAVRRAGQELAHAQAAAAAEREQAVAVLAALREERDRLAAGEQARPREPYTRAGGVREGRPGAPLWALADFRDGLDERSRAGLEAALEASGLLDAWVTPDGRLLAPGTHDVVALPGERAVRPLSEALVTADASARAVLDGIGLEEQAGSYVCADGRWRLGPLHGAWGKPSAEYLGAIARERARQRRLAELADLVEAAEQAAGDAQDAVDRLAARERALAGESAGHPDDAGLRDAHASAATSAERHQDAVRAVDEQAEEVRWAERDLDTAVAERDRAAADTSLPATADELAEVEGALLAYRQVVTELLAAARVHAGRQAEVDTWAAEVKTAEEDVRRAHERERAARRRAAEEQARLATLRAAIGASVEQLKARLAGTKSRIAALSAELKSLEQAHRRAVEQRARAEGKQEQLRTELVATVERREAAIGSLRRFTETGLLDVACEVERTGSWAPDPAVRLARRIEQLLSDVDDSEEAWHRVQDEITRRYSELAEALTRHGHHAVAGLSDWFVVTIQFQGRERPPSELTTLLDAEIDYRERTLTARQREIVEEHLVNDVAAHLQQLIADAEEHVAQMNRELEERPTSTGMRLRMSWVPAKDAPDGLAEARARLLRQGADLWSPADRTAVADFLQAQIEAVRRDNEHGTWAEHLRRALDYRGWHTFLIERYQDGRWRPATGPASGGERVLTVSLPLFAAASSHYRSAHPYAPRLVTLDEAFAGVDDDARAKCLGLLTTFDLDVAMTSEREWGFYPTVPGIATHQLVRRDGIDAVHVTTWEWNGTRAEQVERAATSRRPGAKARQEDGRW
ncbi:TIGR02680 family protein [Nonomuraea antimicrobica]|uniref:TIGR02680 family protein n=1 Tax=Nonomuraea antimicrobica TaxID=561173 RepID=A0ABP7AYR3_9ACTN